MITDRRHPSVDGCMSSRRPRVRERQPPNPRAGAPVTAYCERDFPEADPLEPLSSGTRFQLHNMKRMS
jgi:hypothetical protein